MSVCDRLEPVSGKDRRSTERATSSASGREAGLRATRDILALILSEDREDGHDHAPRGRRRIEVLGQRAELNAGGAELLDQRQELKGATRQAIDGHDHENITGT